VITYEFEGGLKVKGCIKKSYKNKPLISIVTVIFNDKGTFEETIKSVINQKYDNIEFIIIDGGSTDGTLDLIKKYEDKIDYWASSKDKGIYDAMNKGVDISSGDWIYFLGADDILYNVLHKLSIMLDSEYSAVYGDVYMPKRHKLYNGEFNKLKLLFNNICHQSIFYNKSVFKRDRFDLKYKLLSDYAFNIKFFNEKTFKYYPILIARYNDSDGASSSAPDLNFKDDKLKIIYKNFEFRYFLFFGFYKINIYILSILKLKSFVKFFLKKGRRKFDER
jgi:glycosyltransferase involved in cell wall biosynthesis